MSAEAVAVDVVSPVRSAAPLFPTCNDEDSGYGPSTSQSRTASESASYMAVDTLHQSQSRRSRHTNTMNAAGLLTTKSHPCAVDASTPMEQASQGSHGKATAQPESDQWQAREVFFPDQFADNKDSGSSNSPKSSSSSECDPPPLKPPDNVNVPQSSFPNSHPWVRRTGPTWHTIKASGHGHSQVLLRHGVCTEESGLGSDSTSEDEGEWPYGTLRQSLDQLDMVEGAQNEAHGRPMLTQVHSKKRQESLANHPPRPGHALVFTQTQQMQLQQHMQQQSQHRKGAADLRDPRGWDLDGVQSWLKHEGRKHNLPVDFARFHMNGKGLVLMGLQGFQRRMPQNGHVLYRDLRRILRAQQLGQRRGLT